MPKILHFETKEVELCIVRRRKVGYCTDIHVRGGGNMVYVNCKLLILLCCVCLLCVYSSNLPCCGVKLETDLKFWNICLRGYRF